MSLFSAAAADEYDRFMGRYAAGIAPAFADAAGVSEGMRVLDVGCGPGALTVELARIGAGHIAAIDPTPQFVAACQERVPGADVREGEAEALPWDDGEFDVAICSLVIAHMSDAAQGVREMVRVTRPGGTVAACMWDFPGGGMPMIATFWRGVRSADPERRPVQPHPPGTHEGELAERLRAAGLRDVTDGTLETSAAYSDFDDFWEPFTYGAGPASGSYLASLDPERRDAVREAVRGLVPEGGFELRARAWVACGRVAAHG